MCNFVSLISGTSYDKNDVTTSGLRIIRGGNIQSFSLILNASDVFLPLSYINKNSIIQKNDILIVASTGSKEVIGKPAFVDKNYENTTIGAFLRIIRPYFQDSFDYLKIIFKSEYYRNTVRHSVRGTNINNLKADTILDMYVPLPPLLEQQRIVDKINLIEPSIQEYDSYEQKLSSLELNFPDKLKKSIFQYAIEGKLVKQDPNDEPASVLLDRIKIEKEKLIKEGKIKRDKNESYIYQGDDKNYYEKMNCFQQIIEVPFDIPSSWIWARFPSIAYFSLGKTPERHTPKYWGDKYPWISISDMHEKEVLINTKEQISQNGLDKYFNGKLVSKGTLIMSFKLTVGRVSVLGIDAVHNEAIISIFPYFNDDNIIQNWLLYVLGIMVDYVDKTDAIKGSTLNKSKLQSMLIPLPSVNEIDKIINKINDLFALL